METLLVKVKSDIAANMLADFLISIEYVDAVERPEFDIEKPVFLTKGIFKKNEKPSDFAGIWSKKKKVDANKLRIKAWQLKK